MSPFTITNPPASGITMYFGQGGEIAVIRPNGVVELGERIDLRQLRALPTEYLLLVLALCEKALEDRKKMWL